MSKTFGALQTNCVKSQFQIVKIVALMCRELPVIYRVNLTYFTFGMGLKIRLGHVKEIVFFHHQLQKLYNKYTYILKGHFMDVKKAFHAFRLKIRSFVGPTV